MKVATEKGGTAMRIQNTFIGQNVDQSGDVQTPRVPIQQREATVPVPEQASEHVPAPEVQSLSSQAQQIPEVREDRVTDIGQRLAGGEYLTRDAAVRTADALLAAPD